MPLPNDIARCRGLEYGDSDRLRLREECEHCLRRVVIPADVELSWLSMVNLGSERCEYLIKANKDE